MFIDRHDDPREGGTSLGDERATLVKFLRGQRLTLQLKCEGLDPAQLALRAVEPSNMSLLGLLRHMADGERGWFRKRFAGHDVHKRHESATDPDGDFDGAVPDEAMVTEAWTAWRDEVSFAEQFTRDTHLDFVSVDDAGTSMSLRELLVHMIEEYARHNGHADLLRERSTGALVNSSIPGTSHAADRLIASKDPGCRSLTGTGFWVGADLRCSLGRRFRCTCRQVRPE